MNEISIRQKPNKSTTYLLPLIGLYTNKYTYSNFISEFDFPTNHFINTYLYYEEVKTDEYYLYILYKQPNKITVFWEKWEKQLFLDSNCFVEKIIPNKEHFIYKMKFPNQDLYNKYIKGQYSLFDNKDKNDILKFYKINSSEYMPIRSVLYKDSKKKKELEDKIGFKLDSNAELSSIPDLNNETYSYNFSRISEEVNYEE